jgi:hypothetical protein
MAWKIKLCGLAALLLPVVSRAQTSATTTQTLSAQISAIGKVSLPATVSLFSSGSTFSSYTGTLLVGQRVRTTSGGSAAITVVGSAEFTPAGGPTIASGALSYTCGSATLGAACSGAHTMSTSTQTPVLSVGGSACTGGGGACSSADPNTVSLSFTLTNSPAFKTGTFSAQLTFVISAT